MKRIIAFLSCILLLCICVCAEDYYNGYIVKLKEDCVLPFASLYADGQSEPLDNEQTAILLSEEIEEVGVVYSPEGLIKVTNEEMLAELVDMGIVEYAEPDLICHLYGYTPEENQYYSSQWAHEAINSEFAWDIGAFGQEVKVAVIDSGVNPHPDLADNLLPGANFYGVTERGETNGTDTTDTVWHGTFVAGIIAAQCNNIGVVGLAHKVKIVPLKVCSDTSFDLSYIIPAIYAAVDDFDCDVINMSLGFSTVDTGGVTYVNGEYVSGKIPTNTSLSNAISYATSNGVIVVAASGNDGESASVSIDSETGDVTEIRHMSIPAIMSNVISVANARKNDSSSAYPYSISASSTFNEYVDVAAPGTSVHSTYYKNSEYRLGSGTSFAAPYVAAAAAIMKSIDSGIDYSGFNYLLSRTSNSSYKTDEQGDIYWGKGMLDVEALVKRQLRSESVFLSEIDVQQNIDNTSVYIYNPASETCDYTVVIKSPELEKTVSLSLEAGVSQEISLSEYCFGGQVEVSVYVGEYTEGVAAYQTRTATIPDSHDSVNGVCSKCGNVVGNGIVSYDGVSFFAEVAITDPGDYTLVFVNYDENGKLENTDFVEYSFVEGINTVAQENEMFSLDSGDKIMLISGFNSFVPICSAFVIE